MHKKREMNDRNFNCVVGYTGRLCTTLVYALGPEYHARKKVLQAKRAEMVFSQEHVFIIKAHY